MSKLALQYQGLDDECICEESSVKINCTDPYLPMTIIKVPVYGKRCRHIQSFDLETFIRMNGRMKLWNCPHCIEKVFDSYKTDVQI